MRKLFVVMVVIAQLAVLAYMAGEREWVLRSGRSVFLRTAPIDPQDPMRGDYVRLAYEISTVPKQLCRDGVLTWFDSNTVYQRKRDLRVYASIRLDDEGVAQLISLSDHQPTSGLYLRGRTEFISQNTLQVRFGVEALFMQQGKAREFENLIRGEKLGVPLNVEVAVNPAGLAVIKSHRWEPLGITLTLERTATAATNQAGGRRPALIGVTVQLKNHSDQPIAIVANEEARYFRLVPNRNPFGADEPQGWLWTRAAEEPPRPRADEVKILRPGERYEVRLDFAQPAWFVQKWVENGGPGPATSLATLTDEWMASFRVEYAPPTVDACSGLPNETLIRHASLRSRGFGPAGGGD